MGYAIMRINKISSMKNLSGSYKHNFRLIETENADKDLYDQNKEIIEREGGKTYNELFEDKINSLDYYKNHSIRTNAVRAFEVMLTASGDDKIDLEKWQRDNVNWLQKTFNSDPLQYGNNVISAVCHLDEGTPHIHAIVVPIDDKGKLNASFYIDGRKDLAKLQTEYAALMKKEHGLERGIPYSVAKHTDIRRFYSAINNAVEKEAPAILPGENIEEYRNRVTEVIKDMALKQVAIEKETAREMDEKLSIARGKNIELSAELKRTQTQMKKNEKEMDELIREYGPISELKRKLETIESLKESFESYPNEQERAYIKEKMNEYAGYGARKRKQKKEKKKEPTK